MRESSGSERSAAAFAASSGPPGAARDSSHASSGSKSVRWRWMFEISALPWMRASEPQMPPASIGWSCLGSPTHASFAPAATTASCRSANSREPTVPDSSSTSTVLAVSVARPCRKASSRLAMVRAGMPASRVRFWAAAADCEQPCTWNPADSHAFAAARMRVVLPAPAQPSTNAVAPVSTARCIAAARCWASDTSTPSLARRSASKASNSRSTSSGATRCDALRLPSSTRSLMRFSKSCVAFEVKTSARCSVRPRRTTSACRMKASSSARHSAADSRPMACWQTSASASEAVAHDCDSMSRERIASRSRANGSGSGAKARDRIAITASGVIPSSAACVWKLARSSGSGGSALAERVSSAAFCRAAESPRSTPASRSRRSISRERADSVSR